MRRRRSVLTVHPASSFPTTTTNAQQPAHQQNTSTPSQPPVPTAANTAKTASPPTNVKTALPAITSTMVMSMALQLATVLRIAGITGIGIIRPIRVRIAR